MVENAQSSAESFFNGELDPQRGECNIEYIMQLLGLAVEVHTLKINCASDVIKYVVGGSSIAMHRPLGPIELQTFDTLIFNYLRRSSPLL